MTGAPANWWHPGHRYSEQEIATLKRLWGKVPLRRIAERLGRSYFGVQGFVRNNREMFPIYYKVIRKCANDRRTAGKAKTGHSSVEAPSSPPCSATTQMESSVTSSSEAEKLEQMLTSS